MHCPSCHHENQPESRYCARCRMNFNAWNLFFSRGRSDLHWVLRRAFGGFMAGAVAWFFIPIVSRILSQDSSAMYVFVVCGIMGGAFLGCVDGMLEKSSPKTGQGALWGAIGGALGGVCFSLLQKALPPESMMWAFVLYWGMAGAFIGMISAFWERQNHKLMVGITAGFLGGAVGGYFGTWVQVFMEQQGGQGWLYHRVTESLMGAFLGLTLWFFIGIAERFFIFKRRLIENRDHKNCDMCQTKNPLSSWYCTKCGSVLQESAPPRKLQLPKYKSLGRIEDMLWFLNRLANVTGMIACVVAFFIFFDKPVLIIAAVVFLALISYVLQLLFAALSESLRIFSK